VTKAHIRIDVVYERLPVKLQATLDLLNLACLLISFGTLAWFGWRMTAGSYSFGSRSMTTLHTPLVIPQTVWILGISFFLCVALLLLLRALSALLIGDVALARSIAGPLSASDEVRESMEEAAAIIRNSEQKR
jgi:TRAP-type C4-dicarboxylate transport system permease small subunit